MERKIHKDVQRDFDSVVKLLEYLKSKKKPDSSVCLMMIKPFLDRVTKRVLKGLKYPVTWREDFKQSVYLNFLESVFGRSNLDTSHHPEEVYLYVVRTIEGLLKTFLYYDARRPEVRLDEDLVKFWIDRKSSWRDFSFQLDQEVVEAQISGRVCDYLSVSKKADQEVVERMIGLERWEEYRRVG